MMISTVLLVKLLIISFLCVEWRH